MLTLTSRDEDYLETIFRISQERDSVGVTDVAKARNVTVPTARTAVAKLIKNGLASQRHYGKIVLSHKGKQRGREIYKVHKTLRRFLQEALWLDPKLAEKDACLMEHGLSKATLKRLTLFLEAVEKFSDQQPGFVEVYRRSIEEKQKKNISRTTS